MDPGGLVAVLSTATVSVVVIVAAVGITVRLALMPLIKARRPAVAPAPDTARLEARMDAIEEEVRQVGHSVQRMAEVVEFTAQLSAPKPSEPARLRGAAE